MTVEWIQGALDILNDPEVAAVYPRWRFSGLRSDETPVHEWSLKKAHEVRFPYAHHLTVMRRQNVLRFFQDVGQRCMVREQDLLLVHAQARWGRLVALPAMAYVWNLRHGTGRGHRESRDVEEWVVAYRRETERVVAVNVHRRALHAQQAR